MKTLICEESTALGLAASNWCQEKIAQFDARSIYVPAGQTPLALYKVWATQQPDYLRAQRLLQIDEVMTGPQKGMFEIFFRKHLQSHLPQVEYIDRADVQADLAILGLGLNGHVAFHEPGLDPHFYSGCVRLGDITCDHLALGRGAWGLSYGAEAFAKCRAVLIMVSGPSKTEILSRFLARDESLPVTALARHVDLTLVADQAAVRGTSLALAPNHGGDRHKRQEQKDNAAS